MEGSTRGGGRIAINAVYNHARHSVNSTKVSLQPEQQQLASLNCLGLYRHKHKKGSDYEEAQLGRAVSRALRASGAGEIRNFLLSQSVSNTRFKKKKLPPRLPDLEEVFYNHRCNVYKRNVHIPTNNVYVCVVTD